MSNNVEFCRLLLNNVEKCCGPLWEGGETFLCQSVLLCKYNPYKNWDSFLISIVWSINQSNPTIYLRWNVKSNYPIAKKILPSNTLSRMESFDDHWMADGCTEKEKICKNDTYNKIVLIVSTSCSIFWVKYSLFTSDFGIWSWIASALSRTSIGRPKWKKSKRVLVKKAVKILWLFYE